MNIKFKYDKKNGIEYIGTINVINKQKFSQVMNEICQEENVSIFWQVKKNGEFFISVDFCPAKICNGDFIS